MIKLFQLVSYLRTADKSYAYCIGNIIICRLLKLYIITYLHKISTINGNLIQT